MIEEGRAAYELGLTRDYNPYEEGTESFEQWDYGFCEEAGI